MKFNITRDDATFYVDEEKHTVACAIEGTERLFKDFVEGNFRISYMCDDDYNRIHGINHWRSSLASRLTMPNKFIGVAHCGKNDEWNEDIGCTIAFSRAKDALLKSFWKRVETYFETLGKWYDEALDMANRLGEKFDINMEKRHAYIEELVGAAPEAE